MLGFHCDCSVEIDDAPACCTTILRRARKPHHCVECGRMIEPGEQYEVYSGLNNGKAFRHSTCLGCYHIREHFCSGGCWVGEIAEQICECLGFDYRDDPANWAQDDVDEEDEANRAAVLAKRRRGEI